MKIPFSPPYIDQEIVNEVTDCLNSGWITTGPRVRKLEELVTSISGVEKSLGVNSATSGLMVMLHWFGVRPGDEVIIPAYTYCATALAVMHVGATPVMVDTGSDFNLDPEKVLVAITPKTKVVIPVDIGGWPCDYDEIRDVVNSKQTVFEPSTEIQEKLGRILILGDLAHSLGASYHNNPVAKYCDVSVFSFHAVKNVTTAEGGVIAINFAAPFDNEEIYNTLKLWTLNGQTKDALKKSLSGGWKYDIVYPGFKMNMPDICAALGLAQLRKYQSELLPRRKDIFNLYTQKLSSNKWAITPLSQNNLKKSSCHIFALRILDYSESQRDRMMENLASRGIAANVHFIPLPMLTVFKGMGYNINDFPMAYNNYKSEISLPIYPQLSESAVEYIAKSVVSSFEEK